jgi:hypothetical protein
METVRKMAWGLCGKNFYRGTRESMVRLTRVAVVECDSNAILLGFRCNNGVELRHSTSGLPKPLEWHVGVRRPTGLQSGVWEYLGQAKHGTGASRQPGKWPSACGAVSRYVLFPISICKS